MAFIVDEIEIVAHGDAPDLERGHDESADEEHQYDHSDYIYDDVSDREQLFLVISGNSGFGEFFFEVSDNDAVVGIFCFHLDKLSPDNLSLLTRKDKCRIKKKQLMSFGDFRKNVRYYLFGPHLEKGEQIHYVAHRHPFILVTGGVQILFFHFFVPIFFWNVFPEIWFIFLVWVIYGLIALNRMIFNWYFDVILITSMSLIDVTWNGMFDRKSVRLEYSMMEGTSVTFKRFWQTFFNYGTIQVQRQGGVVGIELKDAINPAKVESIIIGYQDKYNDGKKTEDVNALKSLLSEMIKKHVKESKEIQVDF